MRHYQLGHSRVATLRGQSPERQSDPARSTRAVAARSEDCQQSRHTEMVHLEPEHATVIEQDDLWTLALNGTRTSSARLWTSSRDRALQPEMRRVVAARGSLFQPGQFNFAFLMNVDAQVHLRVVPR